MFELQNLQQNYIIPYRSIFTEKFDPGQTIIFKGRTRPDATRFHLTFHNKTADFCGNDVPLHISVRFDEGKIGMNSFLKNEWGKEERKSSPIKKGEPFDIRIRTHDNLFQIFINQREYKDYEYRIPLSRVTHFSLEGDVELDDIYWGGKYYPVPFESGILENGFDIGKKFVFFGIPSKKGNSFEINFLCKNGDIPFHFNPRFDEKVVVRNSQRNDEWGNEERDGKNPFEKGVIFDLIIYNDHKKFVVYVNGNHFCDFFNHLTTNITGIRIQGHVEMTGIQLL